MNKTCSANQELSYIENVLKTQLLLTTTLFHFGTENWEEKLEEQPVSRHQGNYGQTKVDEDKDTKPLEGKHRDAKSGELGEWVFSIRY